MAHKDYYDILGVSRSASQQEIKEAFRKKAMEHHPDRGGDAAKFKEINEAYQALGDAQTRAQYDQYGSSFEQLRRQGFQGAGFDPREMGFDIGDLSDLFGGLGDIFGFSARGGQGRREARGRDIEIEVGVPFEEAVHGATREIELEKINQCARCGGSGAEPGSGFKNCPTCGGAGKVSKMTHSFFGAIQTVTTCASCHGIGKYPEKECGSCHGKGVARGKRVLKIKIPGGIDDGGTIRFAGEGEAVRGGKPGDLYVQVRVKAHKDFERRGNDIWSRAVIAFKTAALGGVVDIPTVDGLKELKIPASTQSGTVIKMKGLGVPHLGSGGRGDHFVEIHIKVPEHLSRQQKKMLEDFEE
ncbi:molecular chaperone DnaJ [Candidatus Uhrbacteria bacterium RIFCSPLOWO2_01_FULL_47_24]|uniref:Chaperone protein DnaJ n=1 Tax=Candidatus Uhrbacteria bacterium RIFCSPLOWO2_01_FULL_47_24 TaxID=1802401 RepID=A0A1F7UUM8_9BACT|nr:MAG: molecular chaperone DnaJ [Candidatus Uhrbacteria bacterium RIFCSPHIGHO2_01_FULL_47_11]OGL69064.1 MAG: molecular chaperone DnaJ [Candidatus Uhrbacteria bacterium RIFCSPHIGHO2_02_FULL_46_47]OGL74618.1 MAG: molecular chaperone DnaJ [Candidatus Uhrbacteria bacterium RIFCSPHIGHO2_12_FULL_47_11]OGL81434.1 MAG: molecular chaperone DnaJ [Candidatus Uhrbacteria bacterium RIFCSPLOWO2_01_FULL_47_24]OGL83702.1 MAG: molecular chaperone DnaJ [Candidatus Uhrbacteria bacterium RIFCSPLOWO2_02_FULL_46_25